MSKKSNFNLKKDDKDELRKKLDELLDTIEFNPENKINKTLSLLRKQINGREEGE